MLQYAKALISRIRAWLSPTQVDQEFTEELDAHLDLLTEENLHRGMTPEAARRAAQIRLGGVTQLTETNRELRGLPMLETFLQDARFAVRMLRKNPGFTAIAVLTLALGIGANTAIFSVVYATLFKSLPYPHSEQLFNVFQQMTTNTSVQTGWSYANLEDLRRQSTSFVELAGAQSHQLTLSGHGEPAILNTSVVTPELFSLFGVAPIAGREFTAEDGKPGSPAVVILSESLWRGTFGANPAILGTSINLDKQPYLVAGIMPSAFRFPQISQADQVWVPLVHDPLFGPWIPRRGGHWLQVTGRLKSGVSLTQAQAELNNIAANLAAQYPDDDNGWDIRTVPLRVFLVGDSRTALLILLGAVGLVLLIACANIANLMLARATSRAREIAVRATLGAGRARIIRQLISEASVLGLLGGLAGIALAYAGVTALATLLPPGLPEINPIRVDYSVLAFALILSLLASVGFGLAPAYFAANSNLQASLREGGGRSGESSRSRRARGVFAALEIALAMVLLVAAGLLLRSFSNLLAVSPGFDVQHVMKAELSLPRAQYSTPQQWIQFSDQLLAAIHAEPGLERAALAVPMPLANSNVNLAFDIVGAPPVAQAETHTANYVSASTEYFRVMGIPLLSGRLFNERDRMPAAPVTLISQAMARVYFPNQQPIGKHLVFGFPPDPGISREIVGVVGDVRDVALGADPGPMMYVPFAQAPFPGAVVAIKSPLDLPPVASAIRRSVASLDKDLPVTDVAEMTQVLETSVAQPRFRTQLIALFAAIALTLAATGIFGVISYSVSCRTNEIGIRVALGATRPRILKMVLGETLTLAAIGLALGIPASLAATRLLSTMLFGVSAADPVTLTAVALSLTLVATAAGYLPARRAVRIDPLVALRHE